MLNRLLLTCPVLMALLLFSGCGKRGSVGTVPPTQTANATDSSTTSANFTRLVQVPLPGFVPNSIEIVPRTELASFTIPIFSPNYAIIWSGNFTTDTLAQSRSNRAVTLDPCSLPGGTQTLTATVHPPLDFALTFPLASESVQVNVESCATLVIESITFPSSTDDGDPEDLVIRVKLEDANGNLILDDNGNRPPVDIAITAQSGTVAFPNGTTDPQGYFRTTATLVNNLGTIDVTVDASLPDSSEYASASPTSIARSSTDPCDPSDPAEEPFCPSGSGGNGGGNVGTDPNFISHDLFQSWFGVGGDYILLRHPDNSVELQIRATNAECLDASRCDSLVYAAAVRDGRNIAEVYVATRQDTPLLVNCEFILLNATTSTYRVPNSQMQIVFRSGSRGGTYFITTSTGDRFQINAEIENALAVRSDLAVNSFGILEGIWGNANGDPTDDLTPRNGSPLPMTLNLPFTRDRVTPHFTKTDFARFISSWRVFGDESLFSTPFIGDPDISDRAYENRLTPEEMQVGFAQFEQMFGVSNPYLAFRFSVDYLLGGIPLSDLQTIYAELLDAPTLVNVPAADADLNNNGTPDVEEVELWDFSDNIGTNFMS